MVWRGSPESIWAAIDNRIPPYVSITDWAVKAIKEVGNYGEIFERNVGKNTPLGLARGLNQLWSKGGIPYAPPIR